MLRPAAAYFSSLDKHRFPHSMLNAKGKNTSRFFSIFAWLERETSSREECNKRSLFLFHLGSDRIPNLFTCHCSSKHKNFSRLVLGAGRKEKRTRHPGNEVAINCVEKCEEQMRKTDKKKKLVILVSYMAVSLDIDFSQHFVELKLRWRRLGW